MRTLENELHANYNWRNRLALVDPDKLASTGAVLTRIVAPGGPGFEVGTGEWV